MTARIKDGTVVDLAAYLARQLNNFSPAVPLRSDRSVIAASLPGALKRLEPILAAARSFTPGEFDPFNSLQHATLLYLLANEIWRTGGPPQASERLFGLCRACHALDLYYRVKMPEVFFLSHAVGAVLGNAHYDEYLVVFQGVTVGRIGDDRPSIGHHVVLYPGAVVSGSAEIGANSVVAAGTVVHRGKVPPGSLVGSAPGGLAIRASGRDYASLYFRA